MQGLQERLQLERERDQQRQRTEEERQRAEQMVGEIAALKARLGVYET
jgi:hypothetical protein